MPHEDRILYSHQRNVVKSFFSRWTLTVEPTAFYACYKHTQEPRKIGNFSKCVVSDSLAFILEGCDLIDVFVSPPRKINGHNGSFGKFSTDFQAVG